MEKLLNSFEFAELRNKAVDCGDKKVTFYEVWYVKDVAGVRQLYALGDVLTRMPALFASREDAKRAVDLTNMRNGYSEDTYFLKPIEMIQP